MKQGTGCPVCAGIAIGPVAVYPGSEQESMAACGAGLDEEQEKFRNAIRKAGFDLSLLVEKARQELGEELAAILEGQMLMLEDPVFLDAVNAAMEAGESAADAVLTAGEKFAHIFASMEDEYMKARSADILDLSRRISDILCCREEFQLPEGPCILVAEDLSPSELIRLPRERLLALVTCQGAAFSHMAILARSMKLPTLVQADLSPETAQKADRILVDGCTGHWYVDPDEQTFREMDRKVQQMTADQRELEAYRGRECQNESGKHIRLYANIGSVEEARAAAAEDADGIGLLRSEFFYLGRETLPAEEELFESYREIAALMGEKPVRIRTLDIGADKQVSYLKLHEEENPALGLRGIRLSLLREDLFRPQLRAIYRASVYGRLQLLFPMVTSLRELRDARAICEEVMAELREEGIPVKEIPIGIMIETPAAAILAADFAEEADFFSVGTNDLTQYTLAADRQNASVGRFYNAGHPAVLALLSHVARASREADISVEICGEFENNAGMLEHLLEMGYTEFSMAPGRILEVKKQICESLLCMA